MVAINERKQLRSSQQRSSKLRSANKRSGNSEKRNHSSSYTFIVPQQATKFFVANNLLAFGERIINCRPVPSKRPVVQGLMRPHRVVINFVRSNEVIEMLLAKDNEVIQALEFYRFHPPLDKSILLRCQLHPIATMRVEVFG